ncbi:MAG: hypothetical protein CME33_25510 [Gimesia sp.]|nr:hypothetical protein [Gimesia sp.]
MLLCETNEYIATEIGAWLELPETISRLNKSHLHEDDWRLGIRNDLLLNFDSDLIFAEFDPMRFEHHGPDACNRQDRAVMYPEDLDVISTAFAEIEKPIILQISSYSANNNNPHRVVEQVITQRLNNSGFALHGRIEADGNMISLVYVRGISLWKSQEALSERFISWRTSL